MVFGSILPFSRNLAEAIGANVPNEAAKLLKPKIDDFLMRRKAVNLLKTLIVIVSKPSAC
jgi:hypothetical protein